MRGKLSKNLWNHGSKEGDILTFLLNAFGQNVNEKKLETVYYSHFPEDGQRNAIYVLNISMLCCVLTL